MIIQKHWITVYPPQREIGSEEVCPAGVNWSALGTVTPDEAIEFANAIIDAANEARRMNGIKTGSRVRALQDLPLKGIRKGDEFVIHSVKGEWIRLSEEETNMGGGVCRDLFEEVK